ncbi:hypothetical protein [Cytobacillus purgationiresistens]|uniref:ABC-type multidrug transport system ATPase subunit n=1 Tax=Cytobacillus purgationiresistens TaxID=863449 RepID=A0ABU0AI21_9BACI|nr:hypothetical protein [Cytobacillus purgationiresistens]MDQ0270901.1 ABC-type multidrug transport system ATPase subunit [Cytobacillus purgationiresistens]
MNFKLFDNYTNMDELQELMVNENQTIFFSTHITTDLDQIADEIVFIYNGQIYLHESIEDIREQFYLVKGAKSQLDADLKNLFLGYKVTPQGFTGLMQGQHELFYNMNVAAGLGDLGDLGDVGACHRQNSTIAEEFVIEPASLEDIMYFMTRGGN